MEYSIFTSICIATIAAGTPLIYAALGELVTEKSGILNLGAEGIMSIGAVVGFIAAFHSGSVWAGVLAGALAGAACGLFFGFLTITLLTNQVATGLAMAIFGLGLSAFIGKPYESATLPPTDTLSIPFLSEIPFFGPVFFNQQWIVYLSWAMLVAVFAFFQYTRQGLLIKAIGESPQAAYTLGYPVPTYRYATTIFGSTLSGIGGTFLSVFYTPLWVEGMVSGRGWISLALVVFASWRVFRVAVGAYLFGGVMILQLFLQGSGLNFHVPSQLLSSLPYLATIAILVLISRNKLAIRLNSPASLGKAFLP